MGLQEPGEAKRKAGAIERTVAVVRVSFNEQLNNRIREALVDVAHVQEKYMFGGVCYMVNGKMCIGVVKEEMMCRIGPAEYEKALERTGCREMVFTGKPMKGYVFVSAEGMKNRKDFEHWIRLCLAFNTEAKAAVKKRKQ